MTEELNLLPEITKTRCTSSFRSSKAAVSRLTLFLGVGRAACFPRNERMLAHPGCYLSGLRHSIWTRLGLGRWCLDVNFRCLRNNEKSEHNQDTHFSKSLYSFNVLKS